MALISGSALSSSVKYSQALDLNLSKSWEIELNDACLNNGLKKKVNT